MNDDFNEASPDDNAPCDIARVDVELKPVGDSPVGLLEELAAEARELVRRAPGTGAKWVGAKVDQEYFKALEIKASIVQRVQEMEESRERALLEREERRAKLRNEARQLDLQEREAVMRMANEERKSKAEAIEKIANAIRTLEAVGIKVDITLLASLGFQQYLVLSPDIGTGAVAVAVADLPPPRTNE